MYEAILELAQTSAATKGLRYPCCIACINWLRRLTSSQRCVKIPLPIDNLILFLHSPGSAIVRPDLRSFKRMMKNFFPPCGLLKNSYMRFCTPLMERIIKKFRSVPQDLDHLVAIWWESVGSPILLGDRTTAMYVRRALRILLHE